MTIAGTNDAASIGGVSTGALTETNAIQSASGQLTITDVDSAATFVAQTNVAGNHGYGHFTVDTAGQWTYTMDSAHDEFRAGTNYTDSITVSSADGTTQVVTVTIAGTNDSPVLSTSTTSVTLTQGAAAVADVLAGVSATDAEGAVVSYSLAAGDRTDLFSIDSGTGVISLTTAGASAVSGLAGAGTLPEYTLHVKASDGVGGVSTEVVTVNVDMAVKTGSTTASLPGSISDWYIAPATTDSNAGFVLTSLADAGIQVTLPHSVTSLSFVDSGDRVTLGNDGSIGTVTYSQQSSAATHTIYVAPGTNEGTLTVLSSGGITVEGAASSSDGVQVHNAIDPTNLSAVFDTLSTANAADGHITMHTTLGTTVLHDVEYVTFDNTTVRIVGAGGYASLTDATAHSNSGDVIYVADSSLASGASGVISQNNISIYIANGETANMTMASSLVQANGTGGTVFVLGSHAFNLTGTAGNDTIHDYTTVATATAVTNIHGGDGADNIVAHNATAGSELIFGDYGNDILIGGTNAVLSGGDGNDILLALGGSAALSGGAGNDVLLNAYASVDASAKGVIMTGGSGSDTFGLIGTNDATASGSMKTIVADLGTGDKVDLSFLEKSTATADGPTSTDVSIAATSDLSGGKATMNTAGTTLNLNSFVATSSEASTGADDVNTHATGGSMVISNATLTNAATAITAGMHTQSAIDFSDTFAPLTDTYNHHS